jgi:hypothetical protein
VYHFAGVFQRNYKEMEHKFKIFVHLDYGGTDANLSYYYQLLATTSNKICISVDFFSHMMDGSKLVTNDFESVDFFFLLSISCHKTTGKVQEIKDLFFLCIPNHVMCNPCNLWRRFCISGNVLAFIIMKRLK